MGKRGPRPKLPQVAKLEGNPGKRPVIDSGIRASGEPIGYDHLSDDAHECVAVVKSCMPPGIYSRADSFILNAFAAAWALHKRALEEINKPEFEHTVASARGGDQPNAWLRILDSQAKLMASLGDRLGLDPKARAALHLPAGDSRPKSKFEGLVAFPGGKAG